ncbi:site-specific DNA-methyltransferase [Agrobacterium vitis]|uniref:Methyltransferase n=1 Tax=Agrobacterium vitis TaxID=373 RepID=A0AAE4W9F4_AGRVI|nr:site-specific DNA-methyltransferase [Agrobacterium vitis]MCF1498532.1 site-specific DNA-methyltransferase [Allorhizobium sp. Av2]MCM2438350.1 site-specific DNA-methyltransferase [Agrobacterium vitis]MUZ56268.1 site-specific DNA-methyltransferase [Agrobacterium vitis]MVA64595.1 site-specific DNA-methyltransferase [Agrobacterium vitis]MVA85566.1 site-specific DNA-methyltransferase [Agrobacterium vitis]
MQKNFSSIRASLGRPAYEDDDILLYNGDCFDLMRRIPSESIPLTVTSPPYNIGKSYENNRSVEDYIKWTADWVCLVHDITTQSGSFWLNVGYMPIQGKAKAMPLPYLIWDKIPFFLIQEVVWNYGAGVAGRLFLSPRNEKLLWYVKDSEKYVFNLDDIRDTNVKYPNQKKNGKLRCNPNGKNPSDVWQIPKVTSGANRSSKERTAHPAQFPLALVSRAILASSNPGDLVLDPFAGSGSTLEAAAILGRKAIGFEIDSSYVEMASNRLKSMRRSQEIQRAQATLPFDIRSSLEL